MLNNYLYVFNTMWEANLTHLLSAGTLTHVVDDKVDSAFGNDLVKTRAYTPNQEKEIFANETWCFKTAFLGNAHTHGAELVFHKSSPSREKKHMWADYRDLLFTKYCPACLQTHATRPRPLEGCRTDLARLLASFRLHFVRSTLPPGGGTRLDANARRALGHRRDQAHARPQFVVVPLRQWPREAHCQQRRPRRPTQGRRPRGTRTHFREDRFDVTESAAKDHFQL